MHPPRRQDAVDDHARSADHVTIRIRKQKTPRVNQHLVRQNLLRPVVKSQSRHNALAAERTSSPDNGSRRRIADTKPPRIRRHQRTQRLRPNWFHVWSRVFLVTFPSKIKLERTKGNGPGVRSSQAVRKDSSRALGVRLMWATLSRHHQGDNTENLSGRVRRVSSEFRAAPKNLRPKKPNTPRSCLIKQTDTESARACARRAS